MSATKLEHLLGAQPGNGLEKLVQHAKKMDALLAVLRDALPPAMAAEVRSANVRGDGTLVVLCSSPAWAARLRFEGERLLQAAKKTGAEPTGLRIRVSR